MDARNLTIIQVNDTHGYLEAHPELMWHGDTAAYPIMGGYARIASILKGARAEGHGSVLALDNGDTFHGTYPVVSSKGAALVPLVNALGFDAMTAHWEFAWGPRHWRALSAQLNHPMLAINCYDVETGELYFPASIVIERGGLRVGIIGIAATIIDKSMPVESSPSRSCLCIPDASPQTPSQVAPSRKSNCRHHTEPAWDPLCRRENPPDC